jgi:hypothetical protein
MLAKFKVLVKRLAADRDISAAMICPVLDKYGDTYGGGREDEGCVRRERSAERSGFQVTRISMLFSRTGFLNPFDQCDPEFRDNRRP